MHACHRGLPSATAAAQPPSTSPPASTRWLSLPASRASPPHSHKDRVYTSSSHRHKNARTHARTLTNVSHRRTDVLLRVGPPQTQFANLGAATTQRFDRIRGRCFPPLSRPTVARLDPRVAIRYDAHWQAPFAESTWLSYSGSPVWTVTTASEPQRKMTSRTPGVGRVPVCTRHACRRSCIRPTSHAKARTGSRQPV